MGAEQADRPACELSVVMPLYNCLALTRACIDSLVRTMPAALDWELVLVDDGSTDGTREWLKTVSDDRIRCILNPTNRGYAASNNLGVAASRGRVVALLNNDLVLQPGWLEPMLKILSTHPGDIVGNVQRAVRDGRIDHAGIAIDAKGKPAHIRELAPWPASRLPAVAVTGACMLLARSTWNAVGGFDEAYINGGEDVDLCFRAAALNRRCHVATRSVILHHVSSSPNRKLKDEANSARLVKRWRSELIRHGVSAWVIQHLTRDLTPALGNGSILDALHLAFYWAGLTRLPPTLAVRGLAHNIDIEIERWRSLGVY